MFKLFNLNKTLGEKADYNSTTIFKKYCKATFNKSFNNKKLNGKKLFVFLINFLCFIKTCNFTQDGRLFENFFKVFEYTLFGCIFIINEI